MQKQNRAGFTLIELMIVVAIIAILAAIAYPSYTSYKVRTNRADVQSELMQIAGSLQSYKLVNNSYKDATISGGGITENYPTTGTAYYTISLEVDKSDNQGYTLTATPAVTTVQNGNGVVCLNQDGQKFWTKGATACVLSNSSTWDGN
ncbi:type IV pilin protein [Acinetobacter sp. MD2(2019)]|uniref:type IV pilin protein n=1 Tax=Acinetobacter sp. MD2(2019) TaxID=2605273 RepID=UPI002D1F6674|nr:type IV pilin protein [Acinetobacter sp. MD2(2019)]MEB3753254.1 prepilin-type N-terminal cleavage/methylation domain-containing protein [Acinetobacter sp. MD2(2019)]